jgi:RHS repeat-associated protein
VQTRTFAYDSLSRLTSATNPESGPLSYIYDAENRLTRSDTTILGSPNVVVYAYDGDGRRVKKTVNSATPTVYVYDAMGELAAEYGAFPDTPGTQYLFADHLGSTRLVTDASGAVVSRHDCQPFGEEIVASVGSRASITGYGAADGVTQRFTGKERDTETVVNVLDYFGARYFSSNMGRFTTPDWSGEPEPIPYADLSDPQTLNLYAYVRNNPLGKNDPDGHQECFANGACNALRNPASAGHWFINGLSNTVSDLLSLDEVAKGSVDVVNAETTRGKVGVATGLVLLVGLNAFTGGEEGTAEKGVEVGVEKVAKTGGRLGSAETRALDEAVAKGLEDEGYAVTHGAGRPQEYIPGPGGARKGSAYPDVTAVKGDETVRVNTVDTTKNGALTSREHRSANKIQALTPKDEFRTVPKKRPDGT